MTPFANRRGVANLAYWVTGTEGSNPSFRHPVIWYVSLHYGEATKSAHGKIFLYAKSPVAPKRTRASEIESFMGYFTMQGFAFQISAAYSAMVRSLENFPEPATFKIALRAHPSGSA